MKSTPERCVTCGNVITDKYCAACGEKVIEAQERSIAFFLIETLQAFTFADTRVGKTFKYLFIRPGKLPREYVDGRRKPYISPLPLFFLVNFLYFLVAPFDTINTRFESQLGGQVYSRIIHDYGVQVSSNSGLTEGEFTAQYNAHSANVSKSLILLFVLIYSIPLMLLHYRKSGYYFDHLMLSLSFVSFLLLGVFMILPYTMHLAVVALNGLGFEIGINWNGVGASLFGLIVLGAYLFLSLKNFYRSTVMMTLIKTPLLLLSLILTLFLYRFLLFFITIWTV